MSMVVLLAACSQQASTSEQIAVEARSALTLILKDPSSAQFTDLVKSRDAICGFVNAKNSLGAYGGYKAFMIKDGKALVDTDDHDLDFMKAFDANCPTELSNKQMGVIVDGVTSALNATQ